MGGKPLIYACPRSSGPPGQASRNTAWGSGPQRIWIWGLYSEPKPKPPRESHYLANHYLIPSGPTGAGPRLPHSDPTARRALADPHPLPRWTPVPHPRRPRPPAGLRPVGSPTPQPGAPLSNVTANQGTAAVAGAVPLPQTTPHPSDREAVAWPTLRSRRNARRRTPPPSTRPRWA